MEFDIYYVFVISIYVIYGFVKSDDSGTYRVSKMLDTGTPDCLYYLVTRTSILATVQLKKALAEAGVGDVKPVFLGVLLHLWEADGVNPVALARKAGLEPSTMTGLLDRMERAGFIVRRADPHDRRALRIDLTDEGRASEKPVKEVVDETLARFVKGLPQTEIQTAKRVLQHALANMGPTRNQE